MQLPSSQSAASNAPLGRKLGFFLLPPLLTMALLTLLLAFMGAQYRQEHDDRILTGVRIGNVEVGGKNSEEAATLLVDVVPQLDKGKVTFSDSATGNEWTRSYADLGIVLDEEEMIAAAMKIGRSGGPLTRLRDTFSSWYFGSSVAPVVVFDESSVDQTILELASEIDQPAVNAAIAYADNAAKFSPGQPGRALDTADLRERVMLPLGQFRDAELELLIHETNPTLYDDSAAAEEIQHILAGPVTFYLAQPLDELDLEPIILAQETLASWLRVDVQQAGGRFACSTRSSSTKMRCAIGCDRMRTSCIANPSTRASILTTIPGNLVLVCAACQRPSVRPRGHRATSSSPRWAPRIARCPSIHARDRARGQRRLQRRRPGHHRTDHGNNHLVLRFNGCAQT